MWHSPSSPPTVVIAPAACDRRALKAAAATATARGDEAAAAVPAPAQPSLRKGEPEPEEGGGEAPRRAAFSRDPDLRRLLGMGTRLF